MDLPNKVVEEEWQRLTTVTLAPLKLVSPLIKPLLLAPLSDYVFIKSRAEASQITEYVQPLL